MALASDPSPALPPLVRTVEGATEQAPSVPRLIGAPELGHDYYIATNLGGENCRFLSLRLVPPRIPPTLNEESHLCVLLHGFPEFSGTWDELIEALRALRPSWTFVAPDQRGYGKSLRPADPQAYVSDLLVEDMRLLLAESLGVGPQGLRSGPDGGGAGGAGRGPVTLVCHDAGGLVGSVLASRYPELVARLAYTNAPHPQVFDGLLGDEPRPSPQQRASGYMQLLTSSVAARLVTTSFVERHLPESKRTRWHAGLAGASLQPGLNWYDLQLPPSEARLHAGSSTCNYPHLRRACMPARSV